jgi:hypothetical protein
VTVAEQARGYTAEALAVTPLNGKIPVLKEWQTQPMPTDSDLVSWFSSGSRNIGIRTGVISRLIAIDIDGDEGKHAFESARMPEGLREKFALTRMTRTGGGGYHILLRFSLSDFPDGVQTTKLWHKVGVKGEVLLQGNNRQIVSPPSVHPETKKVYETNGRGIVEITKAEYEELLAAFGKAERWTVGNYQPSQPELEHTNYLTPVKMQAALKLILPHYMKGCRHDVVFALAGTYRKAGVPVDNTERFVRMLCVAAGDDQQKIQDQLRIVREQYKRDINLPTAGRRMLRELLQR